jgi:hypothetical protein
MLRKCQELLQQRIDMSGEIANAEAARSPGRLYDPPRQPVDQGSGQGAAVQWIYESSKSPIRQGVDAPVAVAADDRQARGRGFQERDPKPLPGAWHREDRRESQAGAEIISTDVTREHDVGGDSVLGGKGFQTGRITAVADHQIGGFGDFRLYPRQTGNDAIMPFVALRCRQTPHRDDHLPAPQPEPIRDLAGVCGKVRLVTDRVGKDAHATGGDVSPLGEPPSRVAADRRD